MHQLPEFQLNPLAAGIQAGDLPAIIESLAPDVVLISPITSRLRFEGREAVGELFSDVLQTLENFRVVDQFGDGSQMAVLWRARAMDQDLEGMDVLVFDRRGRVREIRLFIRPLSGLAALTGALVPRVTRRRSRLRAILATLTAGPLPWLTQIGDSIVAALAAPLRSPLTC